MFKVKGKTLMKRINTRVRGKEGKTDKSHQRLRKSRYSSRANGQQSFIDL